MSSRSWTKLTRSARGTRAVGRRIGQAATPGLVLALCGELGAGKTTFVQGLAEGLDVLDPSEVLSPSYTLVNQYPTKRGWLVHLDFYRLSSEQAAIELGIEEQLLRQDAVIAAEWPERCEGLLPPGTVWIRMSLQDDGSRRIMVEGLQRPA